MNRLTKKLQLTDEDPGAKITYSQLFRFFIPLGTSTLLITISNMLLNRCLGYIPNSEFYISSFSVARTLMLLFMSPVTVIAFVVTSFTENRGTFVKLTKYGIISIIVLQIWFFILSFTPIGSYILSRLYNLDGKLLDNAVYSLKTICFLPVFFFARNYFLGVSIKLRNMKFAAFGSFLRTLLILLMSFAMPGMLRTFKAESVPGILLFMMIGLEALVYAIGVLITTKGNFVSSVIQSIKRQNIFSESSLLSYRKILVFASPLMLSYSMAQLLPSFTQSALALGQSKEIILTVYSVSLSLINIIGSFSFQIPQLVVNHDTFNPNNRHIIRKFCYIIAAAMTSIIVITAFTELGNFIFINILKVSQSNLDVAKLTLKYGLLYPVSMVFMAYKRGKLIKIKKTGLLVFERIIGTAISLILFLVIPVISWRHGAGAGIITLTVANIATGIFNGIIFKVSVRRDPSLVTHSS